MMASKITQCEACGIHEQLRETFFGAVCSDECLESLKQARIRPTVYKCSSCTGIIGVKSPSRHPLCPSCSHHPRMYPTLTSEVIS
jgi:hypothetical protein